MNSIVYVGGLAVVIGSIYPVEKSYSAEVSCNTTLYFRSYNSDDIITVTTTEASGFSPLQGFGVYLNNSQAIVNDITINTSGSTSDAIRTNSERTMFVADRLTIRASGNSADGINLSSNFDNDADALAYVKSFADIQVSSGIAVRANNFQNSGANSVIILPDGTRVSQNGTGSAENYFEGLGYGVYAGNRDRDTNGLSTIQILLGGNNNTLGSSYVFLGDNSTITTSMTNGHAVYANKGGLIQLGDGVNVSTTGSNAYALYASREQQGSYTDNVRPGYIYLGGGATLRAENSAIVIQAKGEGSVIANKVMDVPVITDAHNRNDRVSGLDKDLTSETSGVFDIIGMLDAVDGGAIALNMTSGS